MSLAQGHVVLIRTGRANLAMPALAAHLWRISRLVCVQHGAGRDYQSPVGKDSKQQPTTEVSVLLWY